MTEDIKRGPGRPPSPKTHPVLILRGYYPLDGGPKLPKGTKVDLPIDEAREIIKAGIAERADEL